MLVLILIKINFKETAFELDVIAKKDKFSNLCSHRHKKAENECLFKKKKYEQHALADCRNDDQQLFKKTKQY